MEENKKRGFFNNKIVKGIFKIVLTVLVLYISFIIGLYLLLICSAGQIIFPLTICSALIIPGLLLSLLYFKNKKKIR